MAILPVKSNIYELENIENIVENELLLDENSVKENMNGYWNGRASSYYKNHYFEGGTYDREVVAIQERFSKYIERDICYNILDVGTGPGIVGCSLALLGHNVTCSDISENMIKEAKNRAAEYGVNIDTNCAPADEIDLPDNSFDFIVSRIFTWTLSNPEKAFSNFHRLLKPGGMVIYIDSNFYFSHHDKKSAEQVREYNQNKKNPEGYEYDDSFWDELDTAKYEDWFGKLPLSHFNRPFDWDFKVLPELGLKIVGYEVFMPQLMFSQNIYKGGETNFLIAAMAEKQFLRF